MNPTNQKRALDKAIQEAAADPTNQEKADYLQACQIIYRPRTTPNPER